MNAIAIGKKIKINGKAVDLPKRTFDVVRLDEELNATERSHEKGEISTVDCIKAEYDYLVELFGQDKVDEIFDNEPLEDMDVRSITLAVLEVQAEFRRPIDEVRINNSVNVLNRPEFKNAAELVKAVNK